NVNLKADLYNNVELQLVGENLLTSESVPTAWHPLGQFQNPISKYLWNQFFASTQEVLTSATSTTLPLQTATTPARIAFFFSFFSFSESSFLIETAVRSQRTSS